MRLQDMPAPDVAHGTDIIEALRRWEDRVLVLARGLHAAPELAFEEHRSAAAICTLLESGGLTVERGIADLPTAFRAAAGTGDLVVALCVEYDALPGIGHACGHNLIAGASVGAALALAEVADRLGITVQAIGTPAEEHGGGKSLMLERGAFEGVHAAMMAHPVQEGLSANPAGTSAQAVGRYRATFRGKAAHAAAAPHAAVNAADAAVIAQVAVGLLRQQIPDDHRIGLFVREAGHVTNIIPDTAIVEFECRAFTMPEYDALVTRVTRCFEGAALASGTDLELEETEPVYEPLIQDETLAAHWTTAMGGFGHDTAPSRGVSGGSTDMGNISQVIPSLHPWMSIPGASVPIHTREFAAVADTPGAYEAMFEAAAALALTAAAVAADPEDRRRLLASSRPSDPSPEESTS